MYHTYVSALLPMYLCSVEGAAVVRVAVETDRWGDVEEVLGHIYICICIQIYVCMYV